jgi:hypothetical protein
VRRIHTSDRSPLPSGERARVRGTLLPRLTFECGANDGQYSLEVLQYVGIPKTQHTIALPLKIGVAAHVTLARRMLSPINLDDHAFILAEEINNPTPDWHLAAKLPSSKAPISQLIPELAFGVSQVSPQPACSKGTCLFHTPSPRPSPLRGEGEVRASISNA